MILRNLHIVGQEGIQHVKVAKDKIKYVTSDAKQLSDDDVSIDCSGALAFPGLINSHDHLDFNLFPQLGNGVYNNYVEWGADIQSHNKAVIDSVIAIPQPLRTEWGIYKNLLNGITTVVNHGEQLDIKDPLINVFQNCYSLHSVGREKRWKLKLNRLFVKDQPFVIHVGEGTDKESFEEINKLIRWNLFKRKLMGVHGVAMSAEQAKFFKALIWCPASNFFLLNATAKIDELKSDTAILFGTDSTVSASWNLWEHLRMARSLKLLTDAELFDTLTVNAADSWQLKNTGRIIENYKADIVIAGKPVNSNQWDGFYNLNPEDIRLVISHGNIRLFDLSLIGQVKKSISISMFSKIHINGAVKYVQGNLTELLENIRKYKTDIDLPVALE